MLHKINVLLFPYGRLKLLKKRKRAAHSNPKTALTATRTTVRQSKRLLLGVSVHVHKCLCFRVGQCAGLSCDLFKPLLVGI